VTGLSYKSCVLHISMAVDTMHPATPSDETMNPVTWQTVVDMVSPPERGGETALMKPQT